MSSRHTRNGHGIVVDRAEVHTVPGNCHVAIAGNDREDGTRLAIVMPPEKVEHLITDLLKVGSDVLPAPRPDPGSPRLELVNPDRPVVHMTASATGRQVWLEFWFGGIPLRIGLPAEQLAALLGELDTAALALGIEPLPGTVRRPSAPMH